MLSKELGDESFRTVVCEVEAIVNSRPITFVSNDADDLQPLSPNNLLTMKSSIILPPPGNFQREDIYMRRRWRRVQYLANLFWSWWKREYLVTLQNRQKWVRPKRNITVGDIVIIKEENQPRGSWVMGRVIETEPDKEELVRSVTVKTSTTIIRRPVHKLVNIYSITSIRQSKVIEVSHLTFCVNLSTSIDKIVSVSIGTYLYFF